MLRVYEKIGNRQDGRKMGIDKMGGKWEKTRWEENGNRQDRRKMGIWRKMGIDKMGGKGE